MCYGAGRPSKLFEFLFTLSFLLRATYATRRHGKLSERHIQLMTCVSVEFKLTLYRHAVKAPRQNDVASR